MKAPPLPLTSFARRAELVALRALPARIQLAFIHHGSARSRLRYPPTLPGVYLLYTSLNVGFAYYSVVTGQWGQMRSLPDAAAVPGPLSRPSRFMLDNWSWAGLGYDLENPPDVLPTRPPEVFPGANLPQEVSAPNPSPSDPS